ncbi:hypothetical protein PILCRDRAFT_10262 [Piloderma croceum F 1598]|uniref:Uncharacterized protein n=1 Tax=Piloderma croceum (strain F 1598) TaxID=765440 RepID=A0A0C3FI28_PILCF|nr:hypothetical protein PILCRDRAFT_10262 [Piloderma croceum F 1598]
MICRDLLKIVDFADDDLVEEDATDDEVYDGDLDNQAAPTILAVAQSAAQGAARLSALCDDYKAVVEEARMAQPIVPLSTPNLADKTDGPVKTPMDISLHSELVDGQGKISIDYHLILNLK